MPKRNDLVLVVDVEATCWEGAAPPGQESEIIEIGLCTLDVGTCERRDRARWLVRPERSEVSPFCLQLTGLTEDDLRQGVSFADACAALRDGFLSHQRVWASFGEYDRMKFESQCGARGIAYPFGSRHLNVKALLALAYGLPQEVGMSRALEMMNLPLEGVHHRGEDDAWNIAGILARLLLPIRDGPPNETGPQGGPTESQRHGRDDRRGR